MPDVPLQSSVNFMIGQNSMASGGLQIDATGSNWPEAVAQSADSQLFIGSAILNPALKGHDISSSQRALFRRILNETGNAVAAIRAVREVFGISLPEAKAVWLESVGQTAELTDHQNQLAAEELRVVCPRCLLPDQVVRKLHLLPSGLAQTEDTSMASISERFVNGFWCSSCEVAFVPDHLLGELGLTKYRII